MAPLLPSVEPTANPLSEEGEKCASRPVGVMNVTGHPKGKRNLVSRSGVTPVTISSGEVELPISLLEVGLQLAVWIQDSTA